MQEQTKLQLMAPHRPNLGRAIYKLERNSKLKFHIRRITQLDQEDEKCGVPAGSKQLAKVEGSELQRMREACELQFRHISDLIGRPFPNTTLFSEMEQIKIHTLHAEAVAETSAGSQPAPNSPQPTPFIAPVEQQRLRPPTFIHQPALSPVLPEVQDLDCKQSYRLLANRGMFERDDELQQFLIGDNNQYNDLSDFL